MNACRYFLFLLLCFLLSSASLRAEEPLYEDAFALSLIPGGKIMAEGNLSKMIEANGERFPNESRPIWDEWIKAKQIDRARLKLVEYPLGLMGLGYARFRLSPSYDLCVYGGSEPEDEKRFYIIRFAIMPHVPEDYIQLFAQSQDHNREKYEIKAGRLSKIPSP